MEVRKEEGTPFSTHSKKTGERSVEFLSIRLPLRACTRTNMLDWAVLYYLPYANDLSRCSAEKEVAEATAGRGARNWFVAILGHGGAPHQVCPDEGMRHRGGKGKRRRW